MIATLKRPLSASPRWHQVFMNVLPTVRQHARIAFRNLDAESREECIQNAICNACTAVARLAALGKLSLVYPSVMARFAVAQTRDGRLVGGRLNCRDVGSQYCQRKKKLIVERLDQFDEADSEWKEAVVQDTRSAPVPDIVSFRIDFGDWLGDLPRRNRRIAEALAVGRSTGEVARRFNVSPGRISQVRRELHDSWQEFQGEQPTSDSTALVTA